MAKPFDFVISDLHLMHERIREYCPWNRQYSSREEMTEDIIRKLNEQIPEESTVLCLGDISLNHEEGVKGLNQLNFNLLVTPGNHDKISRVNQKGWEKTREKMLKDCPNVLQIEDYFIFNVGCHRVLFNHYPWIELSDDRHGIKYAEWRPSRKDFPGVDYCCFGHIHSQPGKQYYDRGLDCGFDPWGRAVSYEEIEEIIAQ